MPHVWVGTWPNYLSVPGNKPCFWIVLIFIPLNTKITPPHLPLPITRHRILYSNTLALRRAGATHSQLGKAGGIRLGGNRECFGGWRKKVSPVARRVWGHSSRTPGPWTPIKTISSGSPTSRDHQPSYSWRSSLPTLPSLADPHAPSLSNRDTSVPSGKGNENPHLCLRQWN